MNNSNLEKQYFIILLIAHLSLIWILPYFPSQDGPSHLYNLAILRDLLHGGSVWGDYFTENLKASPNLGFLLIAYPLASHLPLIVIEKIFLSTYTLLISISGYYLLKICKRSIFPLLFLIFPIIFNYNIHKGFYSYCIAVPLFIIFLCICWKIKNISNIYKFFTYNIFAISIYYLHIIPSVLFIISIILIPFAEEIQVKDKIKNISISIFIILPSILNMVFFLNLFNGHGDAIQSPSLNLENLTTLLFNLFFFSSIKFSPLEVIPASIISFLVILLGYTFIKNNFFKLPNQNSLTNIQILLIYLGIIISFIYLFFPFSFAGGSYFNSRFPWVILLVLLPLLETPATAFWKSYGSIVIIGAVSISFMFNAFILWQQSQKIELFNLGLQANIEKQSFIMNYKTNYSERFGADVLLHASSYYGIFKECVDLGNYEAIQPHFFTRFKKGLPPLPSPHRVYETPESIDFNVYPDIRYVLGWRINTSDHKKLSKNYSMIWDNHDMSIWKRLSTPEAAGSS